MMSREKFYHILENNQFSILKVKTNGVENMYEENLLEEKDIYNEMFLDKLEQDDEISTEEEGFMLGYLGID